MQYISEDGHSKKLKSRHNLKKRNIENRFYKNMNYEHEITGPDGTKYGYVQRGDGSKVRITIPQKKLFVPVYKRTWDGEEMDYPKYMEKRFPTYVPLKTNFSRNSEGFINIPRKVIQIKGSDLTGSHEYKHAQDIHKIKPILPDISDTTNMTEDDIAKFRRDRCITMAKHSRATGMKSKAQKVVDKFNITRDHDMSPYELDADNYAITTTNGNNNENRLRKSLNEVARRLGQAGNIKVPRLSNGKPDMNKVRDDQIKRVKGASYYGKINE